MASTGNVFPGTAASAARTGGTPWTTPGNAVSDNATDTTVVVPAEYLVTSNYGFAIPTGATILGVTVRVEAGESGTGATDYIPQLHSATTPTLIGSPKSAIAVTGATKVISTSGGVADLWGATLTPAIVNASGFGVSLWSIDSVNTLAVDFVTIAIEYTVPAPNKPFSANGQSPSLIAGLVGFAGAAAIFHAAEFSSPPASSIPQQTGYSLSTRSLAQPSPVFSRLAEFQALQPTLIRPLATAPQQFVEPTQPVFPHLSEPRPTSIRWVQPTVQTPDVQQPTIAKLLLTGPLEAPLSAFRVTAPQTWFDPQPAFARQAFPELPYFPVRVSYAGAPQYLDQPAPWFARPPLLSSDSQSKFFFSFPQIPEQVTPTFARYVFPSAEEPQRRFFSTLGQSYDVEQSKFGRQPPASAAPPEQPNPQLTGYRLSTRSLDQPAPQLFKPFTFVPPVIESAQPKQFFAAQAQSTAQPAPSFTRLTPEVPVLPAGDISVVSNQQPNSPLPWFSRVPPPSIAPEETRPKSFVSAQLPSTFQPAPLVSKQQIVSLDEPLLLGSDISVALNHQSNTPAPWFAKVIASSVEPSTLLPVPASLAVAARSLFQPAPVFSRQQLVSEAPLVVVPGPASLAVANRSLFQPAPVFWKSSTDEARLPSVAFMPNWAQTLEPPQPQFSAFFFAPPIFPPPQRPHLFATPLQSVEQPQPSFSHISLPSVAPPPFTGGSVGGGALGGGAKGLKELVNRLVHKIEPHRRREVLEKLREPQLPAPQTEELLLIAPNPELVDPILLPDLRAQLQVLLDEEDEAQLMLTWFNQL